MVLKPEQEVSILISLGEALVGVPERHEELLGMTKQFGTGPTLDKAVAALRERFADVEIPQSQPEKLVKMGEIANDLERSPDSDEKLVGHIMQVMVGRRRTAP